MKTTRRRLTETSFFTLLVRFVVQGTLREMVAAWSALDCPSAGNDRAIYCVFVVCRTFFNAWRGVMSGVTKPTYSRYSGGKYIKTNPRILNTLNLAMICV